MSPHIILRWHLRDKRLAHRVRQHSRCWIDAEHGNRLRSVFAPGFQPSKRIIERSAAQFASQRQRRSDHYANAMAKALMIIQQEVRDLHDEGLLGHALVLRILDDARQTLDDAGMLTQP